MRKTNHSPVNQAFHREHLLRMALSLHTIHFTIRKRRGHKAELHTPAVEQKVASTSPLILFCTSAAPCRQGPRAGRGLVLVAGPTLSSKGRVRSTGGRGALLLRLLLLLVGRYAHRCSPHNLSRNQTTSTRYRILSSIRSPLCNVAPRTPSTTTVTMCGDYQGTTWFEDSHRALNINQSAQHRAPVGLAAPPSWHPCLQSGSGHVSWGHWAPSPPQCWVGWMQRQACLPPHRVEYPGSRRALVLPMLPLMLLGGALQWGGQSITEPRV